MSLFKSKKKSNFECAKFDGVLFLMTPTYQNVELGYSGNEYSNQYKPTLVKCLTHYVNNFLVLDKESKRFVQYESINSNSFIDSFFKCDNFGSNCKYDGMNEVNKILFELNPELEDISFDVLSTHKIKIPNNSSNDYYVCHAKTANENIEISMNMSFADKIYKQGFMYNEKYHYNTQKNIIENFKNPLTNFENFISYVDDGSFDNDVFSNMCFDKILEYIKLHIQQMINQLDSMIDRNLESYSSNVNNEYNFREVFIKYINKFKTDNETMRDSYTHNEACITTAQKNNLLIFADFASMFENDCENFGIEKYNNFTTNLINLIILRCLNYMQPFAVFPMSSKTFKQIRLKTDDNTLILKNIKDDNIIVCKDSKIETMNESEIPILLNCEVNNSDNESINLKWKETDEIDEELFKKSIEFIKKS